MIFFTQLHHLFPRRLHLQKSVLCVLFSQYDVLQYRKIVHQLKMLVYHTDPESIGIQRVIDLYLFPPHPDTAALRLVQTEQHTHQSGLSGTILTQQRVNLSFFQLKCDVVVRNDPRKFLCDVQHFDNVIHPCLHFCLLLT